METITDLIKNQPIPQMVRIRQNFDRTHIPVEDITIYHKLACRDIPQGEPVVKYGQHIGSAVTAIQAGQHVHVHNVESHSTNV